MSVLVPKRNREKKLIYEFMFTEEGLNGVDTPHNDVLVLMANICNFDVKRVLTDHGSSSEVM